MVKRLAAEFFGTMVLVFGGVGTAIFAASFVNDSAKVAPGMGVGFLGVALAFGLTVLCMAFAVGHISGGHFNPAVTLGLWTAGRFEAGGIAPYIGAQVLGGLTASALIMAIGVGSPGWVTAEKFAGASNGFGAHSPGGYVLIGAIVAEFVATFLFLLVIVGATSKKAPAGFAPAAIGLALTLVHLVLVPITNASVNPARSIATALFAGGWAVQQLWVFLLVPVVAAMAAGALYRYVLADPSGQ